MKWTSIAVFIAVAALTAPPAAADSDSVAVAINPHTQKMSGEHGSNSASALAEAALTKCNRDHGPCLLVASTTEGCIGIALGDPPKYAYAIVNITGSGSTADAEAMAEDAAAKKIGGNSNSSAGICSDGYNDEIG
jgi:Domain of unknown function (DUF4189)